MNNSIIDPAPGMMSSVVDVMRGELDALGRQPGSTVRGKEIATYRAYLAKVQDECEKRFNAGGNVRAIVRLRADLVDVLLRHLWDLSNLAHTEHALLAVGGYGRIQLHPHSDVDIAILLGRKLEKSLQPDLEAWIRTLFDVGLEIGQSVRTVKESIQAARNDITVMTTLMEARTLCGPDALLTKLRQALAPSKVWPLDKFYAAKLDEQVKRHAKCNDALQELEPNIKESPGGLRDIQVITWVANRHFDSTGPRGLVKLGFITEQEGAALLACEAFLWRIRCALHFKAGRRVDRLSFDYQKSVALTLGYEDDGTNHAVEHFMKDYYRTVREVSVLNEMLLNLFRETLLENPRKGRVVPLNRRFQVRNNAIEIANPDVFSRSPTSLLEIFLLLQRNAEITGIRAATIRELRRNLHRINESFRSDLRARSLFMEIMRQPERVGNELQRMHRYGVLSAYLPAFAAVEGLMQFDLFHIYTVDEHTLFVVLNMRYFSFPRNDADCSPLMQEVIAKLPKLELLYIAGLFHDIAKGRGGDHSALGAEDAVAFCQSHGLSNVDTHLVAWLVRNHLVMSSTAQRKDIYDIEVIKEFAKHVGDQKHLNYLFLLTIADIRGTNPELWTSWKESLINELYTATRRVLLRGDSPPPNKDELVRSTRREARKRLATRGLQEHEINMLWDSLSDNYFFRHRPEEVAWHTEMILSTDHEDLPIVSIRTFDARGGSAVFVYERDTDGLFAITTAALDKLRLDVLDARIITSQAGYTIDTYTVVETHTGEALKDPARIQEVCSKIRGAIRNGEIVKKSPTQADTKILKHFSIEPTVEFDHDKVHNCTVMEVIATDQPGLLSKIGYALQQCDVRLHDARIATFGARAEDYFYITDRDNRRLGSGERIAKLRQAVLDELND